MAGDDKPAEGGDGAKPAAAKDREGATGQVSRHKNRRANMASTCITAAKSIAFKGRIDNLSGHVYDFSDNRQSNQYAETTKEISLYVARMLTAGGDDVCKAIDSLALPVITKPARPAGLVLDKLDKIEWAGNMRGYQTHTYNLEEGMKKLFNIVYGQYSDIMIQKLTAMNGFEDDILLKSDALGLLRSIRQIAYNFKSQRFEPHAVHNAIKQFYVYQQGRHVTTQEYLDTFNNNVDVVLYCGGTLGLSVQLLESMAEEQGVDWSTLDENERSQTQTTSRERYLTTALLLGANKS
jgi:hypothetical protein